jgi:hypothetical protein
LHILNNALILSTKSTEETKQKGIKAGQEKTEGKKRQARKKKRSRR